MIQLGERVMKIVSSKILRVVYIEKVQLYELEVVYEDGSSCRGLKIPFSNIQGNKEIIRFPSVNKVTKWLNSEEGKAFLEESFPYPGKGRREQ